MTCTAGGTAVDCGRWRRNRQFGALAHAPAPQPPGGFDRVQQQGLRRFQASRTPLDSKGPTGGCAEGKLNTVCRKARGQFPKNPCGWPYRQAEGHAEYRSMTIRESGVAPDPSTPVWGRGAFGW